MVEVNSAENNQMMSSLEDLSNAEFYNTNNNEDSNTSSSDEENYKVLNDQCYYGFSSKRLQTQQINNGEKKGRRPTRRPNPNTYNRNALMARENRRKKKEYIEKLEKEISNHQQETKKLRKVVRRQSKLVESLFKEKQYLRSILANKTQIMSLVNVIKSSHRPVTTNLKTPIMQSPLSSPLSFESRTNLDENDFDLSLNRDNSWDCLLGDDFHTENFGINSCKTHDFFDARSNVVKNEHNYYNTDRTTEELPDAGICLHVSGGNVSLEFCATCHENAKSLWLEAV